MVKVSVIIPAYNIENYIERCLNTVINQTLKEIEIIVINDGSTDSTLSIIKKLKTNNMIIINGKNQGVSVSRNKGIKISKGDFLFFLDGDDWLELNALELLYNKAIEKDSDIVCCNFTYDFKDKIKESDVKSFNSINNMDYISLCLQGKTKVSLWDKLIKKSLIIDNNIYCPENIAYGEDFFTTIKIAFYANKISKINKPLYHYLQRNDSVSKEMNKKVFDVSKSIEYIKKFLVEKAIYTELKEQFELCEYLHNYYYRVVCATSYGKVHKELYYKWKVKNIKLNNNNLYKEFLRNLSIKEKCKIKVYDTSYSIGCQFSKLEKLIK